MAKWMGDSGRVVASDALPGSSRFEILGRLGAGGMGVVYEAVDRERGSRVALKTIQEPTGEEVLRLKREFRALQDLDHENLVTIGELFEEAGSWYFTMELVKGVDFLSYVRTETGFDEARLRAALGDLTRGIAALHEVGLIHRDIKPENVLVTDEGRVVLVDFGLSADKPEAQPGNHDFVLGTARYMAPEQATSRLIGPEADMYALGVLLYEALLGEVPVPGGPQEIMQAKQNFRPSSLIARNPRVPRDLDELCRALLEFNPTLRPSAADILHALSITDVPARPELWPAVGTRPGASVFVGRRRELGCLRSAFERVGSHGATAVYVSGESGMGKSTLIRHFLAEIKQKLPDALILEGRCYERESVQYKAFDGLLDGLYQFLEKIPDNRLPALIPASAGLLVRAFPVLGKIRFIKGLAIEAVESRDPRERRWQMFTAFRELISRVAHRYPLILAVDDLHWADHGSLALFRYLFSGPDVPPLLLVGSFAGPEPALDMLPPGVLLELGPLAGDEARDLAESLIQSGSHSQDVSAEVVAMESGGHPLFIGELVRHTEARSARRNSPVRLEEALWQRIQSLHRDARRLLELISLAGAPVAQEAVAAAMGLSREEFTTHLSSLRNTHLARTTGAEAVGPVEPYHDRIREAVLANLDPDLAIQYHERLAVALEESGEAEHDALAIHWMGCGEREKAAMYAFLAAEQAAAAYAFERAARLYLLAMKNDPDAGARLWELQAKLGDALANSGHGAEAAAAFLAAAKLADRHDAVELRWRAAEQLLFCGQVSEGLENFQEVLDEVGLSSPGAAPIIALLWQRLRTRMRGYRVPARTTPPTAAELKKIDVCWSIAHGLAMVDTIRSSYFHSIHLQLALESGEPSRVARGLASEAAYFGVRGLSMRRRAASLLEQADTLLESTEDAETRATVIGCSALVALMQGRFQGAAELASRAEGVLRKECVGVNWMISTAHLFSIIAISYLGDVAELCRRQSAYLSQARERGDDYLETNCLTGHANLAWLVRDDPEGARRAAQDAMHVWESKEFHLQHFWHLIARVQIDLYVGDGEAAAARLRERRRELHRSQLLRMQLLRVEFLHAQVRTALVLAGNSAQQENCLRLAEKLIRKIEREETPYGSALAHLARAGLLARRGKREDAISELTWAIDQCRAAEMTLHMHVAARHRGVLLDGVAGKDEVRSADAWMSAQGIRDPERMANLFGPGFSRYVLVKTGTRQRILESDDRLILGEGLEKKPPRQ